MLDNTVTFDPTISGFHLFNVLLRVQDVSLSKPLCVPTCICKFGSEIQVYESVDIACNIMHYTRSA